MAKSNSPPKRKRKRRQGASSSGRRKGGMMMGMRSGFKGIANSVAGKEAPSDKHKWWGRIITVLLLAAAIGLLSTRL